MASLFVRTILCGKKGPASSQVFIRAKSENCCIAEVDNKVIGL